MIRAHILICGGTGCTSSGSASIQKAFEENLSANGHNLTFTANSKMGGNKLMSGFCVGANSR